MIFFDQDLNENMIVSSPYLFKFQMKNFDPPSNENIDILPKFD